MNQKPPAPEEENPYEPPVVMESLPASDTSWKRWESFLKTVVGSFLWIIFLGYFGAAIYLWTLCKSSYLLAKFLHETRLKRFLATLGLILGGILLPAAFLLGMCASFT